MVVKDRLPELKAAQSNRKHKSSTVALIDQKCENLDNFFKEVQQINDIIEEIQEYVNKIKIVQNAILFAQQNDYKANQELDDLMANTKQALINAKKRIEAMDRSIEVVKSKGLSDSEYRIRKTQHSVLFKLFFNAMEDYNESQTIFKDNCKNRIKRQLEIMGKETSDEELEQLLEGGSHEVFVEGIMRDTQSAKETLEEINARHRDIVKIEKSLSELCEMFTEMDLLVKNQGETIDRIEIEVLDSRNAIESGNIEIEEALHSQSNSRKRKIYLIITLLIVLAAIVIFLVVQF